MPNAKIDKKLGSEEGEKLKQKKQTAALSLWRTNGEKDFRVAHASISLHASIGQWNSQETQNNINILYVLLEE